jgi:hypothetical protein
MMNFGHVGNILPKNTESTLIPIQAQPEPPDFSKKVREPGQVFLHDFPHPTKWKKKEYWQRALPDLYRMYNGICAYCAEWIPPTTGDPTVDHFIPKSVQPQLAYEWSNYRLASLRFNGRKKEYRDVLDPFTLEPDWFILDFPSLQIVPNPKLSNVQAKLVVDTINRLKLNDGICVQSRERWIKEFCDKLDFEFLKRNAPFIAYELERQGLVDKIASLMRVH